MPTKLTFLVEGSATEDSDEVEAIEEDEASDRGVGVSDVTGAQAVNVQRSSPVRPRDRAVIRECGEVDQV